MRRVRVYSKLLSKAVIRFYVASDMTSNPTPLQPQFQSMLSNYRTCQQFGAQFTILLNDLWEADGSQNSSAPTPGDGGSFTLWDQFLDQLVNDLRGNNMLAGIKVDIWDEPDGGGFCRRAG